MLETPVAMHGSVCTHQKDWLVCSGASRPPCASGSRSTAVGYSSPVEPGVEPGKPVTCLVRPRLRLSRGRGASFISLVLPKSIHTSADISCLSQWWVCLSLTVSTMSGAAMTLDGERTTGQDVRTQNTTACMAIANIVKSSLGPVGLDKLLVDDIGEMTITNDGATILQQLEVEHPAAKVRAGLAFQRLPAKRPSASIHEWFANCPQVLVELADLQDQEVGDGTTSVVIIAAELLRVSRCDWRGLQTNSTPILAFIHARCLFSCAAR